jgi:hypothetical protein
MRKLLLQLDSSRLPSVFDQVVAYDAGADVVLSYGGVTEGDVRDLIHGCIFTRGPKDLHNTAVWIGGNNMSAGEQLLAMAQDALFAPFSVSIMLDSNGSNTTAVAAVVKIEEMLGDLSGKKVLILAGTGPVGQRAAGLLAKDGADVTITSRKPEQGEKARQFISARFNVHVDAVTLNDPATLPDLLRDVDVLLNSGPAGVQMVPRAAWNAARSLKIAVDLNAVPPLGIEGIEVKDEGDKRGNVVLDAEAIADIARELISAREPDNRRPPVAKKELAKKK